MKQLMEAFNSGTVEQQNRRKNGIFLICVTAVLLVVAALILTVGAIIMTVTDQEPENPDPSENGAAGYTTTTLDAATQLNSGYLLLLDDEHPYVGEKPDTVVFDNHKSRPKNENNNNIYTSNGVGKFAATEETVVAFHSMIADFYAESGDDNLIIDLAYNKEAGNQADPIYEMGTALSLSYYVEYNVDSSNQASIYEVEKYEWIYDHAAEYGFIQASGEEGDENVFRYVGQPHATYMKKNNKSLSEYLKILEGRSYTEPLKTSANDADGKSVSYSIYRITAEETAYVPEHGKYTVSGDNMGGYIVTVNNTEGKKK